MAHDFNQFITSHGYTAPPGIQHGVIQKIPALGKRQSNTSARVKVVGCSTGQPDNLKSGKPSGKHSAANNRPTCRPNATA